MNGLSSCAGAGPDFLGICEVENRFVIEADDSTTIELSWSELQDVAG